MYFLKTQLHHYETRVNQILSNILETQKNSSIFSALSYATLTPGKRLRPALIYAVGDALQIPLEKLDSLAAAIELIHSYSLVHDDLPAMDNDILRRGRKTCHIEFDEATAILVGDAQLTLAFEVITLAPYLTPKQKLNAIQILSQASGALGMIAGQKTDIENENRSISLEELKNMHRLKTGALLKAACFLGAITQPQTTAFKAQLAQFGEAIGLAFQVQDDILDIESDTQTLGKPQGSDEKLNKSTFPKLMGLKAAKNYRNTLINEAKSHLENLNMNSPFLNALTDYIAHRTH